MAILINNNINAFKIIRKELEEVSDKYTKEFEEEPEKFKDPTKNYSNNWNRIIQSQDTVNHPENPKMLEIR